MWIKHWLCLDVEGTVLPQEYHILISDQDKVSSNLHRYYNVLNMSTYRSKEKDPPIQIAGVSKGILQEVTIGLKFHV